MSRYGEYEKDPEYLIDYEMPTFFQVEKIKRVLKKMELEVKDDQYYYMVFTKSGIASAIRSLEWRANETRYSVPRSRRTKEELEASKPYFKPTDGSAPIV